MPAAKHAPAMSSGNVAVAGEQNNSAIAASSNKQQQQQQSAAASSAVTSCVLRMRGLPYDATPADVVNFFADCPLRGAEAGVRLSRDKAGRPSGEGYVEFESVEAANSAMKLNRKNMGRRYIELFPSSESEMKVTPLREPVLRMRGLPFTADFGAIRDFFQDDRIVKEGILMVYNESGKPSGEAYVQFGSPEAAARAMAKRNRQNMGHRYIELFPSSMAEAYAEGNRQRCMRQAYQHGGYGSGNMGGYGDFYSPHQPGGYHHHQPPTGGPRGGGAGMMRGGGGMMRGGVGRGGGVAGRGGRWQPPQFQPVGGGYNYPPPQPPPFQQHPRNYNYHPQHQHPYHNQYYQQPQYPRPFLRQPQQQQRHFRPGSSWQSSTGHWVHLRGLPFSVTVAEVNDFFAPLKPSRVQLHFNRAGRPNGEADVDFANADEAAEAMKRDKSHIGQRYIDLFLHPAAGEDSASKPGDEGKKKSEQFRVRLRGLPANTSERDISRFFQPTQPVRVSLSAGSGGDASSSTDSSASASGEADVYFATADDQQKALALNGEKIGQRSIDVFLTT